MSDASNSGASCTSLSSFRRGRVVVRAVFLLSGPSHARPRPGGISGGGGG